VPLSYINASSLPVALTWATDSQRLFTIVESTSEGIDPIFQLVTLYPFQRVPADLTLTGTASTVGTMVFAGDARYQPTTVSLTVGVKVDVSAGLRGYYRTTTVSGTSYRVYHRAAILKDVVTVTPAKRGECVELQSQEYSKGAWHPVTTTKCGTLNKSSQVIDALKLTALGRFRVWAYFVPAKTDTANLSTTGSWQYYEVTK
jgi:hypothetical protein